MTITAKHFVLSLLGSFRQPALALTILFTLTIASLQAAEAQTFTVIHEFTGGNDGALPLAGLTMDHAGNLYCTTTVGGNLSGCGGGGCGTVFRLDHGASGWIIVPVYQFHGIDGVNPEARVVVSPNGDLYGTTTTGGAYGYGTVFRLQPPLTACKAILCLWTETLVYSFQGGSDGNSPVGELVFDHAGNIYGVTSQGGNSGDPNCYSFDLQGCGTVYELSSASFGWHLTTLHTFDTSDGYSPQSGVIFDNAGNLYGTTEHGPGIYACDLGCGTVFQLQPSGSGWLENFVYRFDLGSYGAGPVGGLTFDSGGNLYGTTAFGQGGRSDDPIVFELVPSNGSWTFNPLYIFSGPPAGPYARLEMDRAGNLYGTTRGGTYSAGSVFKLRRAGDGWAYTDLHSFTVSDGAYPVSNVLLDANGVLYGTASQGGLYPCDCGCGCGVVWKITP